ncbi:hypothetical protein EVS84_01935 [Pseudomonas koreensis]|uniref:Uncharacterized protein n=1 Tax=Pseudomonas koreensis TaxID=198620 RepID=A0A4Q4LD32_9PSED|nr:hypothetical protein EVS84_01935 [Pseudomonas koreensis]
MGASLLAKAVVQIAIMLTDTPTSRAGSLPHLIFVGFRICVHFRASIGPCLHHRCSFRIARP